MADFFRRRDRSKRAGRRNATQAAPRRAEQLEPRYALSATAVGDALAVNDFTPGTQGVDESTLAVAASSTNRVVVWEGRGLVDDRGVFARVYDADGAALTDGFRVNSTIRGDQSAPSVAVGDDGSFVVVWAGRGVSDRDGVFLQRFGADGTPIGEESLVNTTLGGAQSSPSVAIGDNGVFIVAWEGAGEGDSRGVFFRRFNDEGALSTTEVRANTTTANDQTGASVAALPGGEFVIGWQSRQQDGSDWGVYSQTYNATALPVGGETLLNATTAASQSEVVLAADPTGGYVAAWQSLDQDGDNWGVVARQFGADGAADGAEVILNSDTAGAQINPTLAVADDGQWLSAWMTRTPDAAGWEAVARAFEADGSANAAALVNDSVSGPSSDNQVAPAVAIDGDDAWIVWSGAGAADRDGVYAQAYGLNVVDDPQVAPDLAEIADRQTEEGVEIEVQVTATDANAGDTLTFFLDADDSPDGATLEQTGANTAVVRWTPAAGDDGQTFNFRVIVADDGDLPLVDVENFSVTVTAQPVGLDLNGPDATGLNAESDFIMGDVGPDGRTVVSSIAPAATLTNAATITSATARLSLAPNESSELLSVSLPDGSPISFSYEPTSRTLTLIGSATAAEYEAALQTLVYSNSADDASGTRTVTITVNELGGSTASQNVEVRIVEPDLVGFAQALTQAGAQFFGAGWCPQCTAQKELFEDGQNLLNFIEVTEADRTLNQTGQDNNISVYPTWVIDADTRVEGYQTLAALSALYNVPVPTSTDPFLAELPDETLLVGSPLHVPLDGYDSNGGPLTYTVVSDNPDVAATILSGNRSARIEVAGYGDLVFELFQDRAELATDRFIELAEDDFYDDVIFHRVIDGFVIQSGDQAGTGSGSSGRGDFDDQFNADLQHNRSGLLSMAKQGADAPTSRSGDDTNDSQFFVTEGAQRNLDFNHTVFGILVEGESNREALSNIQTLRDLPESDPNFDDSNSRGDRPVFETAMENVEIFTDDENGVLMLKAAPGATGSANITVTVRDQDGNESTRTFRVDLAEDTVDNRPFLGPVAAQSGPSNTPLEFQLTSTDLEGDDDGSPVVYFVRAALTETQDTSDFTFAVDAAGLVTITPPTDFTGTIDVELSVHNSSANVDGDFQVIPVTFT